MNDKEKFKELVSEMRKEIASLDVDDLLVMLCNNTDALVDMVWLGEVAYKILTDKIITESNDENNV